MSLSWSRPLLVAAFVLAGCKSKPSAEPGAAPAPTPTRPAPAPAAAVSGPALSFLKPAGADRCTWGRQPLPAGEPTLLLTFDAECSRSQILFSPSGQEALAFSFSSGPGVPPKMWRVDVAAKSGKPVELKGLPFGAGERPYTPTVRGVGFDAQGRPVALVALEYALAEGDALTFEGESVPVKKGEGTPGLAAAYRLEGAEWKRFELAATSYSDEGEPGTEALDAAKTLQGSTGDLAESLPGADASEADAQKLSAAVPGLEASGKWRALPLPGGPLYYRGAVDDADASVYSAGPLRWEKGGKLEEPEGVTAQPDAAVELRLRGDMLLVFVLGAESRSAHVFDARTKKKLVSVVGIDSVTFWPEPRKH